MITKAPGRAFFKTFGKNLPFTTLLFGSNAKTNDGQPITKKSIIINCIGTIGYVFLRQTTIANRSVEKIVLVRNSEATF